VENSTSWGKGWDKVGLGFREKEKKKDATKNERLQWLDGGGMKMKPKDCGVKGGN